MLLDHERDSEVSMVKGFGHLVEAAVRGWQEVKGRPVDLPRVGCLVDVDRFFSSSVRFTAGIDRQWEE